MTDPNFEEKHPRGHPSNPGSFGSKPDHKPEGSLPVTEPRKPEPIIVEIELQEWDGDTGEPSPHGQRVVSFDATDVLIRYADAVDEELSGFDDPDYKSSKDLFDWIYPHAHGTELFGAHNGPYRVRPHAVIDAYADGDLEAHVAHRKWALENWEPGTGTPHPTGGYTDVTEVANFKEYYVTTITADGEERQTRHRLDGPAQFDRWRDTESYFVDGRLHRFEGPAVKRANGDNEYYLNGLRMPSGDAIREHGVIITDKNGRLFLPGND